MKFAVGTKQTWVGSALAHVALLTIAQFGLPHFFDDPETQPVVIPVEVVDIGAMTTPPKPAAPEPKPEPKPAAAPPPPPQIPPEPPQAPPLSEPKVAAAPPPPLPAPAKKPEPKPEPPKVEEKPKPVPETRVAKAEPVSKPKPPQPSRDFSSILKDLAADAPKPQPRKAQEVAAPNRKGEPAPVQSRVSDIATMTEIDALRVSIRRQIEPCWSPPIGAREAEDLSVKILVFVEPTGRVRRAEVIDSGRMARNAFFEAAADSARRAVLNDRCNPLKDLPSDKYDLWRELELTFNPKEALG
jgi:outer membrane biosynthesis protein TonB